MACRAGCPTQNHATWGECAREAHIRYRDIGTADVCGNLIPGRPSRSGLLASALAQAQTGGRRWRNG